jgi:hypothetical protein
MQHFILTGYGKFEGIITRERKLYTNLHVLLPSDDQDDQDDVTLDCMVEDRQFSSILYDLEKRRLAGHQLVLGFCVSYTRFGFCHAEQTDLDPKQMVHLHGVLISLYGWLEDGKWINTYDYIQQTFTKEGF